MKEAEGWGSGPISWVCGGWVRCGGWGEGVVVRGVVGWDRGGSDGGMCAIVIWA